MTTSKKLIALVLNSFDSQTSKIKILTELTSQAISEGFEEAYKDICQQPKDKRETILKLS